MSVSLSLCILTFPLTHTHFDGLQIRPLASTDYHRGHLNVLSVLTVVTDPGADAWTRQFGFFRSTSHTYYSLVIVSRETDKIVGAGTVFIERKFLRGLGAVGHIEDIAVAADQQGKKLGLRIIQALTAISERNGCYKTILNCSTKNIREFRWVVLCNWS
jgi:glucosamine-phosphate N-acetyltransferase